MLNPALHGQSSKPLIVLMRLSYGDAQIVLQSGLIVEWLSKLSFG
jgi:hypothetical protein